MSEQKERSSAGLAVPERRFLIPLVAILLAACGGATEPDEVAPDDPCATWNTKSFFEDATPGLIDRCILSGSSLDERNEGRDSPICMAARFTSDPEVIRTLIRHGAEATDWCAFNQWELNDCYGDASVLHVAARDNPNPAVLQALIDAGAQVNMLAGPNWTPLSVVWLFNNTDEVADLLMRNGATGSIEIVENPLC